MSSLSQRGRRADQPLRPDFALFDRAQENLYGPDNPSGAITLCIAENLFQWERLRDKLRHIVTHRPWPDWLPAYAPLAGHPEFRAAAARFVGTHIAGRELDPDLFCGSAGATATVELSALALGDPGDYAVFPAPAYQAYTPDIGNKAGLLRYDIRTYAAPFGPDYHPLTVAELDRAHVELGARFRLLVLTQPDNPTGAVYAAAQLANIADWCVARRIHLVVNEIYALSQFDRGHPEIVNRSPFTSFLPLLEQRRSDYLHWWYSLSKDFGISGFRVGLLYSHNAELRRVYANLNAPHQIANLSQWLVAELLDDGPWVRDFQAENRRLITAAYLTVTRSLDRIGIPYAPARGSLFVWADFSGRLAEPTAAASETLWERIFTATGVLLTAPGGLGQPQPGWLRIVYSGVTPAALAEAMRRLEEYFSAG